MKRIRTYIALALVLILLCGHAAAAGTNIIIPDDYWQTDSGISIAEYSVYDTAIYKNDQVTVDVWLSGISGLTEQMVTPVTGSFNKAKVAFIEEESGYCLVRFEDACYMGTGNTFEFRVNGEVLTLTIHECIPDSELTEPQDQTVPFLQVGRHDQPAPITKGAKQTVTLWVNNISDFQLEDVVVTVTPSSELQITDNSVSYPIGRIWRDDVAFFDVGLYAYGELSTAAQSLTLDVAYTYYKDDVLTRGSASHTVPLQATASKASDAAAVSVPNVIISGYDYGQDKVMAGTSFDLTLKFKNTSAYQTVENMVMTIDPGTALAITSSANSFHFPNLAPGAEQTQTINLQALPDAPSAPASIKVGFRYEYPDGTGRQTTTAEQTISLPVYQLDRFEVSQNSTFVDAWQFQESFLTLQYLNKGKGTVYNVSAELQGDIPAIERVQNVGNIAAGEDGTIDFILTPEVAGDASCTVVVTYEDEAMQVFIKEFTFDLFVNEMFVPEEVMPEEIIPEEETGGLGWLWICLGVAAAAAVTVLLLVRAKKKKKAAGVVDSFTFDDTEDDVHVPS